MSIDDAKPAGIREIAAALGISIGTVDRALHGRPGVSPKTRSRVLRMAEQLNYRPNLAARSLKLNRRIRICVQLPEQVASFFDQLRDGIRAAAAAANSLGIELDFRTYPRLGEGDADLLEKELPNQYDGLILTPGNPDVLGQLINRYAETGTAVVCVASDAPRTKRLMGITADAMASGGIAAELLSRAIHTKSYVATITGSLTTLDHSEKLRGFAATLATLAPHLTLLPAVESHDDPRMAERAIVSLIESTPRPSGLYISTANSLPILRVLEERQMFETMKVIATDLFTELVPMIESGKVIAALHQRPFTQGKTAFESLTKFLLDGTLPEPWQRISPHIVLRSNLHLFSPRVLVKEDGEGVVPVRRLHTSPRTGIAFQASSEP